MKSKKIVVAILLAVILVAQLSFITVNSVFAVETNQSFGLLMQVGNVETNLEQLHREDEFDIKVSMKNISNIGKGIVTIGGRINYTTDVLELISITGMNGWNKNGVLTANDINNGKFVIDNNAYITSGDIFTMKFKVKATAAEPSNATITLNDVTASGGVGLIEVDNAQVAVKVLKPEEKPKVITSTVYTINNTDKDITKILPNTTIAQFKTNIQTENIEDSEMVFTYKGTTLNNDSKLRTGTVLTVGEGETQLVYTLVVRGDIDGEVDEQGRVITENDLANIKLHFIGKEAISAKNALKAADYDCDGNITVNDIAMIKLTILGLINN